MVETKSKKPEITRARAEKLVAQATTPEELRDPKIANHPNKHVRAKAENKLHRLT